MVAYVKRPVAFGILALYALTNLTGELRFKIICFVGWIQYSTILKRVVELWGVDTAGGSEEELVCGEMPLGGLLGKGQLMALLAKILPLMEAQWLSSNSANFQWNFTYSESQNEAECLAELEPFCSRSFVLDTFKEQGSLWV